MQTTYTEFDSSNADNYTDEELITLLQQAKEEQRKAETEEITEYLVRKHMSLVRACCRSYFLADGDKDDLVQEGFIGLLSAINNYSPDQGASFRTFATTCVGRKVINAVKRSSSQKNAPLNESLRLDLGDDSADTESGTGGYALRLDFSSPDPEQLILIRESEAALLRAIETELTPREREAFNLHMKGLTSGEIAIRLGVSPKSADNAVSRAKIKLKKSFSKED